jgi:hypothetical protein
VTFVDLYVTLKSSVYTINRFRFRYKYKTSLARPVGRDWPVLAELRPEVTDSYCNKPYNMAEDEDNRDFLTASKEWLRPPRTILIPIFFLAGQVPTSPRPRPFTSLQTVVLILR